MESSSEGGGGGGSSATVEMVAEGLSRPDVFYVVKEIIGFVLYMHHQIPAILQNLEHEFGTLKEEFKQVEETIVTPTELKASYQRKHNLRKRELKQGIKRLEKLMNSIASLLSAIQQALDEIPNIQEFSLVLGGSPARPQHVYEILISNGILDSGNGKKYTKSKAAEALCRKAIRALISSGAGSFSYAGPSKLFVLIRSHRNFTLPLDFLPKCDFRYGKKVLPFRLHIKCKNADQAFDDPNQSDMIWFQCRHTVKGLASKNPLSEC